MKTIWRIGLSCAGVGTTTAVLNAGRVDVEVVENQNGVEISDANRF